MNALEDKVPGADEHLPAEFGRLLVAAHARLRTRLEALAPTLSAKLVPWMRSLSPNGQPPEAYFTHPRAFPLLSLPWWFDDRLGDVDHELQSSLLYSSLSGYYVIRLIDDVMDQTEGAVPTLLPAVCLLQSEFQATYSALFPSGHPFWPHFHRNWASGHAAAVDEATQSSIDAGGFVELSAQKVRAAIIPLHAVAARKGLANIPIAWNRLFSTLSAFHQRHHDLFDWTRDHDACARTWFLSEGQRRKADGESIPAWVACEGFTLESARLEQELAGLERLAQAIGSLPLQRYLRLRRSLLVEVAAEARAGLDVLGQLLAMLPSMARGPI